jgi:flagellar hook-associated protein 2
MMALSLSGIGSGMDIQNLVKQLVQAEGQAKNNALNRRESNYKTELSGLGTLKSSLSSFKDAAAKLADANDLLKISATSANEGMFTASASSSAAAGEYSIEVVNLAKAQKLSSAGFTSASDTVGTGTLTIGSGSNSFDVVVDGSNSTLAGIRDAINGAADNSSVTATIVNVDGASGSEARLVLTAKETGTANQISIQVTEDPYDGLEGEGLSQLSYAYDASGVGSGGMSELVGAEDARIRVDGMLATRSSNSISDVIPGVTLDLKAETTSAVNLSLNVDSAATRETVQAFVDSYNKLADTYKRLTAYSADTESGGTLQGDFSARQIMNDVRSILRSSNPDDPYGSLFSMGMEIDQYGKMSIDSGKFDEVLSSRPEALSNLLSSADGIAGKLEARLKEAVDLGGILDSRTKRLDQSVKDVADERLDLEDRLQTMEKRMLNQFIAMDTLVAQYNNTGNYLAGQLAALPGFAPQKS